MINNRILTKSVLSNYSDAELRQEAVMLQNKYPEDISEYFQNQILSFRALFKEDIQHIDDVLTLSKFISVKNRQVQVLRISLQRVVCF